MMRRFAAVVLVAGLGVAMAGCGDGLSRPQSGVGSNGLMLTDPGTETHYNLSVAAGSLILTETASGSMGTTDPGLIDSVTGAQYSLDVTRGALTLVPGAYTIQGTLLIELADTVIAKNYALAVVSGALTLIPG
jgi:hypothetical protein